MMYVFVSVCNTFVWCIMCVSHVCLMCVDVYYMFNVYAYVTCLFCVHVCVCVCV